jgi:nucleotide-binding universal stress UspA family protein
MSPIKPVVVGIADKQPTALRFAVREAARVGAPLRVVHAMVLPAQAAEFYVGVDAFAGLREAGQTILDDARHVVELERATTPVSYVLSNGPAVEDLQRESAEAHVVVVGADDISWYERMLGGAVATYLTRHATSAVVVVPEIDYPAAHPGGVVLTLDGDTSASGPLRFALEQADATHRTLHVLHSTPPATLTSDMEAIRANLGEVLAGWSETYPDVEVITEFVFGEKIAQSVAEATERAELVVVGRPHSTTTPFALARPLAQQVVRRARCPVAVVPADYAGA